MLLAKVFLAMACWSIFLLAVIYFVLTFALYAHIRGYV